MTWLEEVDEVPSKVEKRVDFDGLEVMFELWRRVKFLEKMRKF